MLFGFGMINEMFRSVLFFIVGYKCQDFGILKCEIVILQTIISFDFYALCPFGLFCVLCNEVVSFHC